MTEEYRECNAQGRQGTVRFTDTLDTQNPFQHFLYSINQLLEYVLNKAGPSDTVGITVRN
jgi:hypothetical protein